MAKTLSPFTKKEFMEKATPVKVEVGGNAMNADPRDFSTGSFGWYINGKTTIVVDGKPVQVQVGCTLTVVGSKEASRD